MTISTVTTERLKQIASGNAFTCTQDEESASMAAELLAVREAKPVEVTDEMAMAFHRALTDSDIGSDDLDDIKIGLRGALCNYTAPPAPVASTNISDWGIDRSAGVPILVYKKCSVIESETAEYVLSLIKNAAPPAPAVPAELLDAMAEVIRISDRDHEAWGRAKAAISACRAAMLTGGKS